MKHTILFGLILLFGLISCSKESSTQPTQPTNSQPEWLINSDKVFDGGPGKDGIPALENPQMVGNQFINYLQENDLVLGFYHNGLVKGYTHKVLDWHEIINDGIEDKQYAITYCPLTGTGIAWDRKMNNTTTTFGVSGLLYNTNLMPYDRATNSTWSQQRLQCVNGDLIGTKPSTYNLIEIPWKTWKKAFPLAQVTSTDTGFSRDYGRYPYGDYKTNHNRILFPLEEEDNRLESKERVLGVIENGSAKAYRFNEFDEGIEIISDIFQGEELIIVRSKDDNFIIAFYNEKSVNFTALTNEWPAVFSDEFNNKYDLFGKVIEGNDEGSQLKSPQAFIGFWFSWGTFYKNLELYNE